MLEVPALVWQLDRLLPELDFLSVGTNDLMQFFLPPTGAIRRPAIAMISCLCRLCGFWRMCKTNARRMMCRFRFAANWVGDRLRAMALFGLGYRRFFPAVRFHRTGEAHGALGP